MFQSPYGESEADDVSIENERDFREVDSYIDEIRKSVDDYKRKIDEC